MPDEGTEGLKTPPPQDIEAEQMVLGAVLVENEALAAARDLLRVDDFYRTGHQIIFQAMLDMREKEEAIDLVTLTSRLRNGSLEKAGGASYLSSLVALVPTAANIRHHAAIIVRKAQARAIIRACSEARGACYSGAEPEEALTACINSLDAVRRREGEPAVAYRDLLKRGWEFLDRRSSSVGTISGVSTGFRKLDQYTDGMWPNETTVLAARPSMGKSAFAMQLARNAAWSFMEAGIAAGKPEAEWDRVLVFSCEMGETQVALRELCRESGVPLNRIREGDVRDSEWDSVVAAVDKVQRLPMVLEFSAFTDRHVERRIDHHVQRNRVRLIVTDYLQLLSAEGRHNGREAEVSAISRMFYRKKKTYPIHCMVLAQLNRNVEGRVEKRPLLADLRESGALEQDADNVWFIHREEYYHKCTCPPPPHGACTCGRRGAAELLARKGRMNGNFEIPYRWSGRGMTFEER